MDESASETCGGDGWEPAGYADYGWDFECVDGAIYEDDLTARIYEDADGNTCEVDQDGPATVVYTCETGCGAEESHYEETFEEWAEFDPATMCAEAVGPCGGQGWEACGYADNGWDVWCADGNVYSDDLTAVLYCDASEEYCEVEENGPGSLVHTCDAGCLDTETRWFKSVEDWSAFDYDSLCAKP